MKNLKKDLIFFDLETTGVDTNKDRIVEIAAVKYKVDGTTEEKYLLINPTIPIPKEASDVHGITDDKVKDAVVFNRIAKNLYKWFHGCDIGGFNSNSFDVNLLEEELIRAGIEQGIDWNPDFIDVLLLYRKLYPNTLSEIYKRMFNEELTDAHSAVADVKATKRILEKIIEDNNLEDKSVSEIDLITQGEKLRVDFSGNFYKNQEGEVFYNFGGEKDKKLKNNSGLATWALSKDFSNNTKRFIKNFIKNE